MDIYLTPSGGSRIQFPMLPEAITMGADAKFMTYSIISLGDVKLPRGQGTKEISWSGMFPGAARKKNRLVRKYTKPDTLIKNLEKYRDKYEEYPLDPTYEPDKHEADIKEVNKEHEAIFATLQRYVKLNLVVPVGEEHMYYAAIHHKACKLTTQGQHYWNLVKKNTI